MTWLLFLIVPAALLVFMSVRIVPEYERLVVFLLGRLMSVSGPGLVLVVPGIQTAIRVDVRTRAADIPQQDIITRDNISVKVNAVLYYRVVEPEKAIVNVANFIDATEQLGQTTLRSVLGQYELDDILASRDKLSQTIQELLDKETDPWGVKVSNVELKHVDLEETMIRAMARQAEAERARRAKVIHAVGELEASEKLVEAAEYLGRHEAAMQLRYLHTLTEITKESSHTVVFPLPTASLNRLFSKEPPALPEKPNPKNKS